MSFIKNAPDVANERLNQNVPIDFVGLQNVKIPVKLTSQIQNSAEVSLLVSLDNKKNRGVHMSRLYLVLHESLLKKPISFTQLKITLKKSIQSQKGDSSSGRIQVKSHWPVLRKALKSSIKGWREYPFYYEVSYSKKTKSFEYVVGGEVLYSSTCPCSASLATQIISNDFKKKFPKSALNKTEVLDYLSSKKFLTATPHAQKSSTCFKLKLKESSIKTFSLLKVIDEIEKTLGTAVQTAVKREDEAEFAKRNGENLMFCEDAIRRLALLFKNKSEFSDYVLKAQHYESLHPFTVQSTLAKGLKGGWKA